MADREDIDALLVGALYGELDETDRARLDAHLASHPQDRMSLDAMRSTRGLLRDADLAAAMVEPPAAVSALLLQEAARRAPQARTAGAGGGGILGFLASFLRPVMAHPALATAAMLVVVAGTAGALYLRGSGQPIRPDRSLPAAVAPTASATGADVGEQQGLAANEDKNEAARENEQLAAGEHASDSPALLDPGATAGSALDSYRVTLDDGKAQVREGKDSGRVIGFAAGSGSGGTAASETKQLAKGSKETERGYVEVARADQPSVRPPEDDRAIDLALGRGDDAVAGNLAPGAGQRQAPQAPPPPPMAPRDTRAQDGLALAPPTAPADSTATYLSPRTTATGAATTDSLAARPYNARSDAATIAWAKDQHARMIKLVDAGKCNDAASVGVAIQRRAPDYYQDSVYNDRRIRACRAYVDRSRRATEPARKRDLPSPAAADEAPATEKATN